MNGFILSNQEVDFQSDHNNGKDFTNLVPLGFSYTVSKHCTCVFISEGLIYLTTLNYLTSWIRYK